MKPRTIAELGLVALVALAVAATTYVSQNRWSQAKVTGAPLFPSLTSQGPKITRIELRQGDKKLALERKDQAWVLADRGGYPAKPEAVRTLLVRLAEAQLVEPKTRKSDRFAMLELEDAGAKDTKSREVRLLDQQGGSSPRPSSAKSAWMRSARVRLGPTCAGRKTPRPGSPIPTLRSQLGCATGCSRP